MHLSIQGRHLLMTPALNEYVKNKLKKIKYYFDHIIHVHVVLEVMKKVDHIAEVTITVERHHFHNKVKSDDMYRSIDMLFDKIEIQVRRYKEYLIDKRKKNQRAIVDREVQESLTQLSAEKVEADVIEIEVDPKPMSTLEALLQMQTLVHRDIFGYYKNPGDEKISYIIRGEEEKKYFLFVYDGIWERHELLLLNQDHFETLLVQSNRPPTERIEDAVTYLNNHLDETHRFFISVRTHMSALLFRIAKNRYKLLRQLD